MGDVVTCPRGQRLTGWVMGAPLRTPRTWPLIRACLSFSSTPLSALETLPCSRSSLATSEVPCEDVSFLVCTVGRVCSFTCPISEPEVALGIKRRCWSVSILISLVLFVEFPQKHSSLLVSVFPVSTMSW